VAIRAALIVAVLALAACVPTTRHPLLGPDEGVNDARLTGAWAGTVDKQRVYFHFIAQNADGFHVLGLTHGGPEEHGGWSAYGVRTTQLGATRYLSVELLVDDAKLVDDEERFLVMRYRLGPTGELEVWTMSEEPVILDIEAGKLAGEVDKGRFATDIDIAATTGQLAAYVAAADPERVFADLFVTLKRME
jgi:hypothetical protein